MNVHMYAAVPSAAGTPDLSRVNWTAAVDSCSRPVHHT